MSDKTHPAYRGPWPRIRRHILERDNYECLIQLEGCTKIATQVDHITPVTQGGAWWNPDNLRGACQHCNLQRITKSPTTRTPTTPPTRNW